MKKRLLSWLLAVCMLLSMLPVNAFAAEVDPSDEDDVTVEAVDEVETEEPEEPEEEPAPPEDIVEPDDDDTEEVVVSDVAEETVTEPAAASVIDNITIEVRAVSRFDTDRNPTADCWTPIDVTPDYVTVSFTVDGNPVTYSGERWEEVEKPLKERYGWGFYTTSPEVEDDPWTSGFHTADYVLQDGDWNELARGDIPVNVYPSPILDIQTNSGIMVNVNEQNRETRGEVEGWSLGDYPTDCQLTYIPREKYNSGDFDERADAATFEGTGSELVEMLEAEYDGIAKINHFATYAWQDREWEEGDEGTCAFYICGVGTKYIVTGVSGPAITGIEAGSVTMFLGDNQTVWDEETECEWSRLDCCTESATVYLDNGGSVSFSGRNGENPDDLVRKLQNAGVRVDGWGWTSEETSTWHWTAPGEYSAVFWLEYQGAIIFRTEYDVTVLANPIASIQVDDITRTYESRALVSDWEGHEWYEIDCNPDHVVVTLTDGTKLDSNEGWPGEQIRNLEQYRIYDDLRTLWHWESDQSKDNEWTVGPNHTARQIMMGKVGEYNVNVIHAPFDSVAVAWPEGGMKRLESDRNWDGRIDCWPGNDYEVTLYKGNDPVFHGYIDRPDEEEFNPERWLRDYLEDQGLGRNGVGWDSDETEENPWHVGDSGRWWLNVAGIDSGKYPVTVVELPFDGGRMEIEDPITRTDADRRRHAIWLSDEDRLDYDNEQRLIDCWPGSDNNTVLLWKDGVEVFRGPIDAPDGEEETDQNCLRGWLKDQGFRDDIDWASWETDEDRWGDGEYGAWLVVCGLSLSSYSVRVISNPIESIAVEPYSLFFEDCWLDDEWHTDEVNPYVNRRYDVYPGDITVTMTDGKTRHGDLWEVRDWVVDNYGYDVDWGWYHEPLWGTSKTLCAHVKVGDNEICAYTVPLVDSPVKTVSVGNINRFLSDRFTERYWNEALDRDVEWQRVDCWPDNVSITLKDGTVLSGSPDEVRDKLRRMNPDVRVEFYWESDERHNARWTTAGTHDVTFAPTGWQGATTTYQVTVMESQIKSVHADNITRYEDYRWWLDHIGEEGYDPIDCWPDRVTVTLKDNSHFTGNPDEVREWLENKLQTRIQMDWWSIEGWKDGAGKIPRFTAGTTYEGAAWFEICGVESNHYNVTVKEFPVASVTAEDVTVFDTNRYQDWREREDGSEFWWNHLSCDSQNISVVMKDSAEPVRDLADDEAGISISDGVVTLSGDPWYVQDLLRDYYDYDKGVRFITDEEPVAWGVNGSEGNWVAREAPYTATCIVGGAEPTASCDYSVTVMENPIDHIEVDDIVRYESDREERWDDDSRWFALSIWPDTVKVFLKGNTTGTPDFTGNEWQIKNWLRDEVFENDSLNIEVSTGSEESRDNLFEAGHTYDCNFSIGGSHDTYKVEVRANPIAEVSVAPITRFITDTDHVGWDNQNYDRIDCWPDQVTVTMNANVKTFDPVDAKEEGVSGSARTGWSFTGDPNQVENWLGEHFHFYTNMGWDNTENAGNHWKAGTYRNGARFWLLNPIDEDDLTFGCRYDVTVVNVPIKNLKVGNIERYDNERNWQHEDFATSSADWQQIDCYPDYIELDVVQNGKTTHYDGDMDEVFGDAGVYEVLQASGARINWNWTSEENWKRQFHEGTFSARFSICGVAADYEVSIVPCPIASITPFEIWRFPSQTHEDLWWGDYGPEKYECIDLYPGAITVKLINQAPYNGKVYENVNFWTLEDQIHEDFPDVRIMDSFDSDQSPSNPWGLGEHTATLRFCGASQDYAVHVVENPVTGAKAEPITVDMGKTFPCRVRYPDENGDWQVAEDYPLIDLTPDHVTVSVDGIGDLHYDRTSEDDQDFMDRIGADLSDRLGFPIDVYWDSDQMPGNTWYPGAHKGILVIGDVEAEYDVQVNADLENATVVAGNVTYNGKAQTPAVTVTLGGTVLRRNVDYSAAYTNNTNAGTATITVTGKTEDCFGTARGTFTILKTNQAMTVTAPTAIGKNDTATLTVKDSFGALTYTTSDKTIATVSAKGVVKGLKGGTVTITVKAAGDKNHNAATKQVKITIYPCATPAAPTFKYTNKGVQINWLKTTGAAKYRVFYKKDGAAGWSKLADVTGTSYTWNKGVAGTKYSFTVRCISADGKTNTSYYNENGRTVVYYPYATPAVPTLQNAPTGLKISWTKTTGPAKYRVFYKKAGAKSWTKLVDSAGSSYIWTKAVSGTQYTFTVRCVSADGKTYTSNFNTTGKSIYFVAAPTLSNSAAKTMKVSWKKITGVTGYQVSYATASSFKGAKTVNVKGAGSVSTLIKSLKKGTTYYVRIRTYTTKSGKTTYSVWSGTKSIKLTK